MSARIEAADGRRRQSRRDEQIRRKLEQELGKRKNRIATVQRNTNKDLPKGSSAGSQGSVMALKPLPPVTMPFDTLVLDAAQYMTAYRASCVLVLDEDNAVCGIFTAKDLAFKVVAQNASQGGAVTARDLRRSLTVADVMTPEPLCTNINSSATEALNIMVSRGFRHLPIMDDKGEIAGVLDITLCFFEAMTKLERAYASSKKLRDALEGVNSELGSMHPQKIMSYVEALKEHTSGPELSSVIDPNKRPISVNVKSTVAEAAILMREHRMTSVLVMDHDNIAGIFTTKDIVLRVLAADIESSRCSVVRVMTPHPQCAPMTMNIQQALRMMHDGHFLNLPVKNEDNEVVSVVDVLRLTYATLEHLSGMTSVESAEEVQEGPAWNKFWMSLDQDTESEDASKVYPHGFEDLDTMSQGNVSDSELAQFSIPEGFNDGTPSEFGQSDLASSAKLDAQLEATKLESDETGSVQPEDEVRPEDSLSRVGMPSPQTESQNNFSVKFKAPSGRAHRVVVQDSTTVDELRLLIQAKLSESDLTALGGVEKFAVSYLDDDKDVISITTESDIRDAVEIARKAGAKRAEIYLHHADQTPIIKPRATTDQNEGGMVPVLVGSAAAMMFGLLAWGRK